MYSSQRNLQPSYGGINVAGKGLEKGNFLQRTEAEIRFTVLVEIKRSDSLLLGNKPYRNGAWQLGEDLTGGGVPDPGKL